MGPSARWAGLGTSARWSWSPEKDLLKALQNLNLPTHDDLHSGGVLWGLVAASNEALDDLATGVESKPLA